MLKRILKSILPEPQLNKIKGLRLKFIYLMENNKFYNASDNKKIFTQIYLQKKWGSNDRSVKLGTSGSGSHDHTIVNPYIKLIHELSDTESFKGLVFVDLGCGDFSVGKSIHKIASKYIAVDIVKELIDKNNELYSNECVEFKCLDIVNDDLPDGDVCFIRQVLQHLSNEQIKRIIQKTEKYKWVFITEHHPSPEIFKKENIDKSTGMSIRLTNGSGIYITEPPFSVDRSLVSEVLAVPDGWSGKFRGTIKTFLYKPNRIQH